MTKRLAAIFAASALSLAIFATPASAEPDGPTNGGSHNGGGQSGQCTGPEADRPAACHNGHGAGN